MVNYVIEYLLLNIIVGLIVKMIRFDIHNHILENAICNPRFVDSHDTRRRHHAQLTDLNFYCLISKKLE